MKNNVRKKKDQVILFRCCKCGEVLEIFRAKGASQCYVRPCYGCRSEAKREALQLFMAECVSMLKSCSELSEDF